MCVLNVSDEKRLAVFERRMLRQIFDPEVNRNTEWYDRKTNQPIEDEKMLRRNSYVTLKD